MQGIYVWNIIIETTHTSFQEIETGTCSASGDCANIAGAYCDLTSSKCKCGAAYAAGSAGAASCTAISKCGVQWTWSRKHVLCIYWQRWLYEKMTYQVSNNDTLKPNMVWLKRLHCFQYNSKTKNNNVFYGTLGTIILM